MFVLDWGGVLEAKEDRGVPVCCGAPHIIAGSAHPNEIVILLEPTVPLFDVRHRFAKVLVIRNGHVNGVYAAVSHLTKDLL